MIEAGQQFKVLATNRLEELCMASPAVPTANCYSAPATAALLHSEVTPSADRSFPGVLPGNGASPPPVGWPLLQKEMTQYPPISYLKSPSWPQIQRSSKMLNLCLLEVVIRRKRRPNEKVLER